jgi:hypothetical protein
MRLNRACLPGMLGSCASIVAAGLFVLTTGTPVALAETHYDECKAPRRSGSFGTVVLADYGDGSECLTIEHSIKLSGRAFPRETRLRFVCTGGQCPEFICHNCTLLRS